MSEFKTDEVEKALQEDMKEIGEIRQQLINKILPEFPTKEKADEFVNILNVFIQFSGEFVLESATHRLINSLTASSKEREDIRHTSMVLIAKAMILAAEFVNASASVIDRRVEKDLAEKVAEAAQAVSTAKTKMSPHLN